MRCDEQRDKEEERLSHRARRRIAGFHGKST
jgi:hypothetical protein